MRVMFPDIKFGLFDPCIEIEYNGKKYRGVEVEVEMNSGEIETHTIAEIGLQLDMARDCGSFSNICNDVDDSISYYADDEEYIYDILEQIVGESFNDYPR